MKVHQYKISGKYENTNKTRSNNLTSGGTTSDFVVKSIIKLYNIIRRV
jgi:hypothetical protein